MIDTPRKKPYRRIFQWAVFLVLFAFIAAIGYALFTTSGAVIVLNNVLARYIDQRNIVYDKIEGNLAQGLTFKKMELKDVKDLPKGSILRVQELFVHFRPFGTQGLFVEIENARLKLPGSDPVVIAGTFKQELLDFNVFSKGFTVTEVLTYLPDLKNLIPIRGELKDIDLHVQGHYLEPVIKGKFTVVKFVYQGFILSESPWTIDLQLKDIHRHLMVLGNVVLDKGQLQMEKTLVTLERGRLNFSGAWDKPHFDFKGRSRVEKTKINITLKGTLEKPDLQLSSEPPYSTERLMVMLATGKSWQSVEDSLTQGFNSAAVTKDFIDYFFFSGKSNTFAQRFGISDFSVTLNGDQKGIAAKKDIADNLKVGYGIEQTRGTQQTNGVKQTLEGQYKLNDQISLDVGREVTQKENINLADEKTTQNNDKVLLKYKMNF